MRTSIDIPDPLLAKARRLARARGVPLRQLVIEGLRQVTESTTPSRPFRLRDAAFGEGGLVEGLSESDWPRLRDLAYGDRGG